MILHPQLDEEDLTRARLAALDAITGVAQPVCIAILDAGGHPLWLHRHSAAPPITVEICLAKARSAALSRKATAAWEQQFSARPVLGSLPGVLPVKGGVPIFHEGHCLGSVAVAGASSEEDLHIAQAVIDAMQWHWPCDRTQE